VEHWKHRGAVPLAGGFGQRQVCFPAPVGEAARNYGIEKLTLFRLNGHKRVVLIDGELRAADLEKYLFLFSSGRYVVNE
jgi:hypothetical protein